MKKTSMFIGFAFVATLALAQDKPAAQPQAATASADANPVIVSAGDIQIHKTEFENALKTLPPEYQQYAQGAGKKEFAENYLRMKMLAAEGYKAGLDKDAEVQQQLSIMRDNLVANAQLERIESSVKVSDEDLRKIYDANKKDYEQVKARHILIAFKGSPAAPQGKKVLTDEEAKAKAESIRKQLVAGANFEELAKKESDDTGSGARGGDLGAFGRGQMVPEFEEAAFNAKVGEIAPIVKTQFGYHIIKVEKHEATPFEDVKASIEKREHQKAVQAAIEDMKAKANPTFSDAYFGVPAPAAPAVQTSTPKPAAKPAAETKKPATKH